MAKKSKSSVQQLLNSLVKKNKLSQKLSKTLLSFYEGYLMTTQSKALSDSIFFTFIELVRSQYQNPYPFEPFHEQIRKPFDYYIFGKDFLRPLIDASASSLSGEKYLKEIEKHLKDRHNVIFFSNHQIEADPQAIALLLEEKFEDLAKQMIVVAGERVTTDPMAIPFSLGCNLLCIFSKRYIDHPPEKKYEKQFHNKKTMQLMSELLKEGGKCIYVFPSGGRDRKNDAGEIEIAPFDPQSIEMFYLMAKKSKTPTFFYTMALGTYELLPPPKTIQVELGEQRSINRVGIHLTIGPQIDMQHYEGRELSDKHLRRKSRADYIWKQVYEDYQRFPR